MKTTAASPRAARFRTRLRGRPAIPLATIIATALQIVDEDGAEALTVRELAQRLKSSAATFYRHFANRGELIAHVVDRVLGDVELDADALGASTWQAACSTAAHAIFEALTRHKNVAPLLVGQIPSGPNAMAHRERLVAVLLAGGFPPRLAALAYATLAHYVLGFAMQLEQQGSALLAGAERPSAAFREVQLAGFPATNAVAPFVPVPLDVEFAFGTDLIIRGLEDLLGNLNKEDERKPAGARPS